MQQIVVKVRRDEDELELEVPFDVERKSAPRVELPVYDDSKYSEPRGISQLVNLAMEFSDLESELDNACVEISSRLPDGERLMIVGTMIRETALIVSKNSMVKDNPAFNIAHSEVKLEVIARDKENDLILLKAPKENSAVIEIITKLAEVPRVGSLLIAPDSKGAGIVSVVSTTPFTSRKEQSRGFLGVLPADYRNKGGAILRAVTEDGVAERAGLRIGDVITKLNQTAVMNQRDLRIFLGTVDPNATVVAKITRGENELEKTIRLGALPSSSNHAADQMNKSGRRDGFRKVIPHDAD